MKKGLAVLLVVILVIVAGVVGFSLGKNDAKAPDVSNSSAGSSTADTTTEYIGGKDDLENGVFTGESTTLAPVPEGKFGIISITEDNEWVNVETTYGKFRYPFAFSDLVKVEAEDEGDSQSLEFSALIDDEYTIIYTINYNSDEGMPCGILMLDKEIPVSVEFEEISDTLNDDWASTFYAAQETFNDVVSSMAENENFTMTQ